MAIRLRYNLPVSKTASLYLQPDVFLTCELRHALLTFGAAMACLAVAVDGARPSGLSGAARPDPVRIRVYQSSAKGGGPLGRSEEEGGLATTILPIHVL